MWELLITWYAYVDRDCSHVCMNHQPGVTANSLGLQLQHFKSNEVRLITNYYLRLAWIDFLNFSSPVFTFSLLEWWPGVLKVRLCCVTSYKISCIIPNWLIVLCCLLYVPTLRKNINIWIMKTSLQLLLTIDHGKERERIHIKHNTSNNPWHRHRELLFQTNDFIFLSLFVYFFSFHYSPNVYVYASLDGSDSRAFFLSR